MNSSLRSALERTSRMLEESGADAPRLCAELLLARSLGLERGELLKRLILEPGQALAPVQAEELARLAARRAAGEPAAYILGTKEFYGRDFVVTPAVLIPRPETELLVDMALERARGGEQAQGGLFADLGAGSGCIAVTLALELPAWRGIALDRSGEALAVAAENARRLGAGGLCLVRADFAALPFFSESLDLVVSNPPYVSEAEYRGLERVVRDFEPRTALVPSGGAGEATGLEDALAVIAGAGRLLRPGGILLMEMGAAQGRELLAALDARIWSEKGLRKDLAGLDRVLWARKERP